ncbi:FKBP-type peptidyl-prolyl cis-trans isomerase [Capnocytophaga sp.]|uniref:FKBP-type peptidyl-prolyl cis-trans isomerase n=1 Tax=Capnocytophaga sp. TaxID=44737 RepID=UPI0026DA86E5|nr:FKBP-type peptidyl-prolyl cis-trans isomerase [Capnocytophaga sp.]MDO5105129.1 peptidylprolyl isomerase [Capnocytophaga sp.]
MIRKTIFSISSLLALTIVSCKKDNSSSAQVIPPRDVTEVRDENDAAITAYLKTHFYKLENNQVILDTIAKENAQAEPLFNKVQTIELDVFDANNNKVRHKLYYLPAREGSGKQSSIADSVFVSYKGQLLNGKTFDQSVGHTLSNWTDLLGSRSQGNNGTIRGYREGIALLKDSQSPVTINNDGTISVPEDGGVGVFFIPSALAYFNSAAGSIPAYSPLIFTVNLIKTKNADHDHDGIPSIKEIKREDYGIVTYPDCDNDGFPDYLDADKCKE